MKFLRFRHNWAHGSQNWEYMVDNYGVSDPEEEKYLAEDLMRENNWSDKYRGVDIESVESPKEWLENEIEMDKSKIKNAEKRIEEMTRVLSKLQ
jgi:hypothetical protein